MNGRNFIVGFIVLPLLITLGLVSFFYVNHSIESVQTLGDGSSSEPIIKNIESLNEDFKSLRYRKVADSFVPGYSYHVESVPEIETTPTEDIANIIAFNDIPVKLLNSVSTTWPALHLWSNLSYLSLQAPNLTKIGKSRPSAPQPSTFLYYHPRPFHTLPFLSHLSKHSPKLVNLSSSTFFKLSFPQYYNHSVTPKSFYYYSQPIQIDFKSVAADIQPLTTLLVKETSNPTPSIPRKLSIWIGQKNITTRLHYDFSHNFHVQILGSKRFILFPPSAQSSLSLYPFLHPFGTKSQIPNLSSKLNSTNLTLKSLKGYEAVIRPGEVLYIPPMWFHEVVSEEPSISLSVWSTNEETDILQNRLLGHGLPFTPDWSPQSKILASLSYIKTLVTLVFRSHFSSNNLEPVSDEQTKIYAFNFLLEMIKSRYKSLVDESEDYRRGVEAMGSKEEKNQQSLWRFYDRNWSLCPDVRGMEEEEELERGFEEAIKKGVGKEFEKVGDLGRKEVWLGNYVELVGSAVVDVREFGSWINCLRSHAKQWKFDVNTQDSTEI